MRRLFCCLSAVCCFGIMSITAAGETVLFEAGKTAVKYNDGMKGEVRDNMLSLSCTPGTSWPGITLGGKWSLAPNEGIALELVNLDKKNSVSIRCRLDSTDADVNRFYKTYTQGVDLLPGETRTWIMAMPRRLPPQLADKLFGMRGYPGGAKGDTDGHVGNANSFDPADVATVILFVTKPSEPVNFGLRRIFVTKAVEGNINSLNAALELPPEKFFPMIDRYGQYKHADWPGKIKSDADLKRNIAAEDADMAAYPVPKSWNRFGGWATGPQREAMGRFRAEKIDGRWWLIDPEGRLFWSHGTDSVRSSSGITPISEREFWFDEFPTDFFGTLGWSVHGHYKGKSNVKTFNFTASNLKLKYGDDWRKIFDARAHVRLRSWGMNTIGNWSDASIYDMKKTPYTATLAGVGPVIAGSTGYWGQFRDPFHPEFRKNIAAEAAKKKDSINDPYCIGVFVDNELGWGDETSLAVASLLSPADQPAKVAFVETLQKKYGTIAKLNAAWGTGHVDWNALLAATTAPDKEKAKADLQDFYTTVAEKYFGVIREEFKKIAPNTMYFGCRFSGSNERAVRAAAKFCDVVSFNKYTYTLADFKLPEGVDKGVIIGEFHFGALDRGMFHTGLRPVESQAARAAAYETYVTSALKNPAIVGTHWFLFGEQATTGRGGDGENYQIGLLDVCDTPYPETIRAVRKMGETMYERRFEK